MKRNNNHRCKICQNILDKCICKSNKNAKLLKDFARYCEKHPEQRFWQALRNWSSFGAIYVGAEGMETERTIDTYYFEGKDK